MKQWKTQPNVLEASQKHWPFQGNKRVTHPSHNVHVLQYSLNCIRIIVMQCLHFQYFFSVKLRGVFVMLLGGQILSSRLSTSLILSPRYQGCLW